jgi:uncharacterized protein YneF (UPF0154 family)
MGLLTVALLGVGLLLILGGLVGHSLSQHLMTQQIREQATVRREIGEQWRAMQAARRAQGSSCPECGRVVLRNDGDAE